MVERISSDITIFSPKGEGLATVPITEQCKRSVQLMERDEITLSFILAAAIDFPVGSYVEDEIFGKFYVTEEQMPRYSSSNGGYSYELRLNAWYYMWNLKQMMLPAVKNTNVYTRKEATWHYTQSLKEQMRLFMVNLNLLGYVQGDFMGSDVSLNAHVVIDPEYVPNYGKAFTMDISGTHLLDFLRELADKWECEYWITGDESNFVIHFGKCESGSPVEIDIGSNAESIEASDDTSERGQKLSYYGSEDNIPLTYRKVLQLEADDVQSASGFITSFKAKHNERPADIRPKHLGAEKNSVPSGYVGLSIGTASGTSRPYSFTTTWKEEMRKEVLREYSGLTLPFTAMLWNISEMNDVTAVVLRVEYTVVATQERRTMGDKEYFEDIVYGAANDGTYTIDSIAFVAYDASDATQGRDLSVDGWRNIAEQAGEFFVIGDTMNGAAAASFFGAASISLSTSVKHGMVEWINPDAVGLAKFLDEHPDFNIRQNRRFVLYEKTLCLLPVPSESDKAVFRAYYLNNGVPSELLYEGGSWQWPSGLSQYQNTYSSSDRKLRFVMTAGVTSLLSVSDKVTIGASAQSATLRLWLTPSQYNIIKNGTPLVITPRLYFGIIDSIDAGWYRGNSVDIHSMNNTSLPLKVSLLSSLTYTITEADITAKGEAYYTDILLSIGNASATASWSSIYVRNGFWPILLMETDETGIGISRCEFVTPVSMDVIQSASVTDYVCRVEPVANAGYTDYRFTFLSTKAPGVGDFGQGTAFSLYELTEATLECGTIWGIPYAYWVSVEDNPTSLLASVASRRLQLPIVDPEECQAHGMSYLDGYIVYNGMAYKDGYIIPLEYKGDDGNKSLREITVIDDTVYPDAKLVVSSVTTTDMKEKEEVEGESEAVMWDWQQYHLKLSVPNTSTDFPFKRDMILANGEPLKIRFLTKEDMRESVTGRCMLAGMQFEVEFNERIKERTMDYAIVRNSDFGAKLPNDVLYPTEGDPCVLVNWNVRAIQNLGLILDAEYRLLRKAFDYFAALREGNFTFKATMMSDWLYNYSTMQAFLTQQREVFHTSAGERFLVVDDHSVPPLGQRVTVKHSALKSGEKITRIIGMEMKLDKPYDTPQLTIGETEAFSRLKKLEKDITMLNK